MAELGPPTSRTLDELAISTLPPRTIAIVDGWLLRAAPDLPFRRASAAVALPGTTVGPVPVASIAAFADRWSVRARVVVGDGPGAEEHDAAAEAVGWAVEAPVEVLCGPAASVLAHETSGPTVDVRWSPRPDELTELASALGTEVAARTAAYGRALGRSAATGFAVVAHDGDAAVGVAVGAVDRGATALFGLAVHPGARRLGLGAHLSRAVARAGGDHGGRWLWLQVERANAPALALYRRLGLARSHGYHYRTAPEAP